MLHHCILQRGVHDNWKMCHSASIFHLICSVLAKTSSLSNGRIIHSRRNSVIISLSLWCQSTVQHKDASHTNMSQKRANEDPWSAFSHPFWVWNHVEDCVVVPHPSLHLLEGGYPSKMMNSFCTDEVSVSLARCGRLKSDGEILVNDELRGDTSFSLKLLWILPSA